MRKLLLVSLFEREGVLPIEAHRLLAQRLVLKAIANTRAVDIAFWECSDLAESFGVSAGSGHPDLQGLNALAVLGRPSWLAVEASPWTEVLVPLASMADYERTRIKPLSFDVAQLNYAGVSAGVATKLLEATGSIDALRTEAKRVDAEVLAGGKITQVGDTFRRKKDVALVLAMREIVREPITMTKVLDLL